MIFRKLFFTASIFFQRITFYTLTFSNRFKILLYLSVSNKHALNPWVYCCSPANCVKIPPL